MTSRLTIPLALAALLTAPVRAQNAADAQTPPPVPVTPSAAAPLSIPMAATPSSVPSVSEARSTGTDYGTEIELLNRIQTLLDRAVGDRDKDRGTREIVGTSGSSGASLKVLVDRAELDEIRAEIAQIKLMLQGKLAFRPH